MITARFRIQLPPGIWVRDVSEAFPDAAFRLLSGYRLEGTAVELGEVVADDPAGPVEAHRTHPSTVEFELLESADGRALAKYETRDTGLYEFVETPSLPIEFPVVARNGWFEFDLTGTREDLDELRTALDAHEGAFELLSLVDTRDSGTLLTDRQRELMAAAVRAGYYEVPRECTLAELAESMGVDKASASTVLRRGEASLVKWFLTGPETKGRHLP